MDFVPSLIGFLMAMCHLAFRVRGEEASECGGMFDASKAGYITSPGYPLEYPPHQNCHWIITAPESSQRIVLNFNPHFEIERLDCKYDFIEIRDGTLDTADVLGRHCSNIAPAPIISSGPSLQIKFVSDYAHQGAGFSLRYEIFKTGSEFCFRNFTSPSGMIDSPGFPDKYPHNLECSYMIIAPPRMDITLTFLTFDLENDPLLVGEGDCKYDWLDVWDGLPQVSPLIGRYCGTKIPPEIQSSSGLLSLSFHTDMAVAKDGFSARYNMTHKEVTDSFHCSMALGLESGKISDDQISASTTFYDSRWLPRQARLNNDDNAWTPSEDSNKEFIQVCVCVQDRTAEPTTPAETVTPTLPPNTETTTVPITTTAATSSSSDSVCDFDHGLCGWTHDPNAPLFWSLHSHELNSYLYMDASLKTEQQRARLVSPVVAAETGPLCLLFSYQLWGEAQGHLKVLLRDAHSEETLLWTLTDDQGSLWKEGRTILPRSPKDFQVVMEGFFVHGTRGHIWIDNIHISSSTPLKECTQPFAAFPPENPGGGVPVPPLPIHWYYIMAAGGALLLLAVAILVRALCCCRQHLATKKSQLSVAYHSSSQCFQYSNWSSSMAAPGVEPVLTVRLDSRDRHRTLCLDSYQERKPNEFGDGRLFSGRDPLGGVLQFPEWNTASPSSDPPVTRVSEKDNSWLYTLDPILVTIIVMSSLGVLLGAVCAGLLLYCTCSYSGLSSRSSTTLENYNFELYDGLKHKVKLNQQRCCTEA
ncbi:LOW QUALITY PROTEIN: neuropilin-2a [Platichthys flesus]|uniref:LOW QUALITY PROTEIN: neuropilin-2a n=1 Tax=Platichthys flesus TaxID=8260 RepID=UPI002DBA98EF|nr:LOW QUALITY PROTEIN: neuropilin-2a [Platichthys flesus]